MLTEKQLKIIDIFRKNLGKKLTFNQIKTEAYIKSNNFLQTALNKSINENIISSEQVGKSFLYSLELNNVSAFYLGLLGRNLYSLPHKLINKVADELSREKPFFIGVVFGSYAKNKQQQKSDLDLVFITPDIKTAKTIEPILENIKRKEIIKLDTFVFTQKEFKEMLSSEKENMGKEILRNHLVFYNSHSFYALIKQWIHL